MKKLSIIASALVLSSAAYAANSVDEAFKNGTVSGDVSVHHQSWDNGKATDSGFTAGTIGINYSTADLNGLTINTGFRAAHEFGEKEDGNFDTDFAQNSVMNVANISYANDLVSVTIGRQEIDLEWLGDFNEAVVLATTAIPNTTLVAGYSTRQAAVGNDELGKFEDKTKDGAYVIDAKYEGFEGFVINPYFYSANDVLDFYGLKVDYDNDKFGVTAHYAESSEDDSSKDTDITHLEARTALSGLDLAAGYIKVGDKEVGNMSAFGDNIDPTEELGDYVYAAEASTFYVTAGYEVAGVGLSALYAVADSDATNKEDKELTLGASYGITDSLSAELMYIDLSLESGTDGDKSKTVANLTYEF